MKKILFALILIGSASLTGCGQFQNQMTLVGAGMKTGDWKVTVWSGGQPVKVYEINDSFVSTEENSDGWFFNYNGKLVRVTGTITIEEL